LIDFISSIAGALSVPVDSARASTSTRLVVAVPV
jgi:hypothetical protein